MMCISQREHDDGTLERVRHDIKCATDVSDCIIAWKCTVMAAGLLYVAAALMMMMMYSASAQVNLHGRCEKITIPLCTGMKYNMTRMPNLVGIANQKDAALQVYVAKFTYLLTYISAFVQVQLMICLSQ